MKYALGNMLNGAGGLNADQLALDLQFAADKTLAARRGPSPILTRGSSATLVNSAGLIEYAPENLFQQSENFGVTYWSKSGLAVTGVKVTSPYGNLTADTINVTTAFANVLGSPSISVTAGQSYTVSFWHKRGTATDARYSVRNENNFSFIVPVTSYYSQTSSNWTRISFSFTVPAGCNSIGVRINNDSSSTGTMFLWGAQLETGASLKSYNPTTTAAFYGPRFDHDPVTLACRGLLIEEGRTNLVLQSEDINSGAWQKINGTTSNNFGTSPDGTTNADKFVEDAAVSGKYFRQVNLITIANGTAYAFSVYAKPDGRNFCTVNGDLSNGFLGSASFDLLNGTVGAVSAGATATIQSVGSGWYRLAVTSTSTGTGVRPGFLLRTNATGVATQNYQGDGVSGVLFWGAQLEAGSFATSYILTTTSALARSADVCSITGANFAGMYNPLEGSFFTSAIFNSPVAATQSQLIFDVNDTTSSNRTRLARVGGNGFPAYASSVTGVQDVTIIGTTAMITGQTAKISCCMKVNDFTAYWNNILLGSDTTANTQVSPTTLTIGEASQGTSRSPLNGTISFIRYYRKRLPNAKLQALTV